MDLHEGKNQCEGTFTFSIKKGCYGETDLRGLKAGLGLGRCIRRNMED
jgi:hypothetical protein